MRTYHNVPDSGTQEALDQPAYDAFSITKGETLDVPTRFVYVGSGGDLTVTMLGGGEVTLTGVPDASLLPIRVTKCSGDADDLVGFV